jgi:hypothetical protein
MDIASYLLSYGKAGEFALFSSPVPGLYQRGEQVVVKSRRGLELGFIMREAGKGHTQLLGGTHLGAILRPAIPDDLEIARRLQLKAEALFEHGRRLGSSLQLPIEIFDTEILLDGHHGVLYVLRWSECDPGPLLDAISEHEQLSVTMQDLGPAPSHSEKDDPIAFGSCGGGNCGESGCGSCQKGNCSSCKNHHSDKLESVAARISSSTNDKRIRESTRTRNDSAISDAQISTNGKRISLA